MSGGFDCQIQPGDVISYMEMCSTIGVNLQRGMNFRLRDTESVILMSLRPGAPYADRVEDEGRTLIYEGHDVARTADAPDPKKLDQPGRNAGGSLRQNGLFAEAARKYKDGVALPEQSQSTKKYAPAFGCTTGCSS